MINGSISSNLEDLFHDIHGTIKIEKLKYVQPSTLYVHQNTLGIDGTTKRMENT